MVSLPSLEGNGETQPVQRETGKEDSDVSSDVFIYEHIQIYTPTHTCSDENPNIAIHGVHSARMKCRKLL